MKKNLISAVAAGLALALAITSFGCESGNDTPVHLAYTRARYAYADDAAAEAGDVFTYVAKPNSYQAIPDSTGYYTADHRVYGGTIGHYEWRSVIEGENAYNVISSDTKKGDVDGTKVGDRVSTVELQISLNAADKTYVVNTVTTQVAVNQLVAADYTGTDDSYDSTFYLGWKIDALEASPDFGVPHVSGYDSRYHDYVSPVATPGQIDLYAHGTANTIVEVKQKLHDVIVDQLEVIEDIKNDPLSKEEDLAAALLDLSAYQANLAYAEGARVWISKQSSLSGILTKEDTFLTKEGGKVISTYLEVAGDYEPITGTYKVAGGNYKDGTILLTSIEKDGVEIVFDDKEGKYYLDGMGPYDMKDQFYEAPTTEVGGDVGREATYTTKGRTLKIADGVLTSTAVLDEWTLVSAGVKENTNDFLLGDSFDTYKDALDEVTDHTQSWTHKNTSYKFVLDDN